MLGIISMILAYVVAKNLDDLSDYKLPRGKNKNRYK